MNSPPDKPLPLYPSQPVAPIAAPPPFQEEPYNRQSEELVLSSAELVDLMRQILSRGMPFRFRARGASMAPFIQDGDTISIVALMGNEPGLGDVTAFLHPQTGRLVVHRVVGKHGRACLIQGDNAYGNPELVTLEYLQGKVTQVERNGRQIWLGLGPERYFIALSSRTGLLLPLVRGSGYMLRRFFRKSVW